MQTHSSWSVHMYWEGKGIRMRKPCFMTSTWYDKWYRGCMLCVCMYVCGRARVCCFYPSINYISSKCAAYESIWALIGLINSWILAKEVFHIQHHNFLIWFIHKLPRAEMQVIKERMIKNHESYKGTKVLSLKGFHWDLLSSTYSLHILSSALNIFFVYIRRLLCLWTPVCKGEGQGRGMMKNMRQRAWKRWVSRMSYRRGGATAIWQSRW